MATATIEISVATMIVAVVGGFASIAIAIIGYQTRMMITDIKKSIDTLFDYNDELDKALGLLRTDHEKLHAECKVRHQK